MKGETRAAPPASYSQYSDAQSSPTGYVDKGSANSTRSRNRAGALLATPQRASGRAMTSAQVLRESTEQRIRNQIGRVFRGTFGAEQGLCTLVELATIQMRSNGMSRAAIHDVLARLVSDHSCRKEEGPRRKEEHPPHEPSVVPSESQVRALSASVVRWSDGTRGARVSA
jgi:hypothetical protein